MSKIDKDDAWKLMEKLTSYEEFKNQFSGVDVLKLIKEDVPIDEIFNKIIISKYKEISENENRV